jgi:hypothetical protein
LVKLLAILMTAFLLLAVAVVAVFFQLVALNGVSEKQGLIAIGIFFLFQAAMVPALSYSGGRLNEKLHQKLKWNPWLAFVAAVGGMTVLGLGLSFAALVFSILVAGVR